MTESTLTITEAISAMTDIVTALATMIAAAAAVWGVFTWRRELRGRTEYDMARRCLTAVYRVRNAISAVRAPVWLFEYSDRPGRDSNKDPTADDYAFAYGNRWIPLQDAKTALDVELLEAEALWGVLLQSAEMALRQQIVHLNVALTMYLRAMRDNGRDTLPPEYQQRVQGLAPIGQESDDDVFAQDVSRAVKEFERLLLPHLGRVSTKKWLARFRRGDSAGNQPG
jgi:hypothetical protein